MEASTVSSAEAVPRARRRDGHEAEKGPHPVVHVGRRGGDRAVLPVSVLLADQHFAQAGQRPPRLEHRPRHPTLNNYSSVFKNPDFVASLRNSAIVASITTALALVVGSLCAYALARLKLRGKFVILGIVLSITTFPQIAIAAPLFKLWSDIGLFDTYIGLIIPYLTFALPLAIFILVSFFREIPKDLEEAALVDGATRFQAFRKIVVPLAAPGLATAGILTFIAAWNEFLLAVTLTATTASRTVPAEISFFTGATEHQVPYGSIAAASVVISVPLILLVLLFQKRIVAGLTAGAVKG